MTDFLTFQVALKRKVRCIEEAERHDPFGFVKFYGVRWNCEKVHAPDSDASGVEFGWRSTTECRWHEPCCLAHTEVLIASGTSAADAIEILQRTIEYLKKHPEVIAESAPIAMSNPSTLELAEHGWEADD